jgi:hypothetical protein
MRSVVIIIESQSHGTQDERFTHHVRDGRAERAMGAMTLDLHTSSRLDSHAIIGAGEMSDASASSMTEVLSKKNRVIGTWRAMGRPGTPIIVNAQGRRRPQRTDPS